MGKRQQAAGTPADVVRRLPLSRVLGQVERHVTRIVETTLAGEGLTVDQWRVLDILRDGQGHPMSELAGMIVVPGATLTKIVNKLVDTSLVDRLVDDRDRRRVLAFVSPKGRRVHARLEPKVAAAEAEAVAGLGGDGDVLIELLAQLVQGQPCSSSRS